MLVSQHLFSLEASIFSPQLQNMPRQVIVLKVHMRCDRCRTKALKTAVEAYGVMGARLDGEKLIVEGSLVRIEKLVQTLMKKVGWTDILRVYDV